MSLGVAGCGRSPLLAPYPGTPIERGDAAAGDAAAGPRDALVSDAPADRPLDAGSPPVDVAWDRPAANLDTRDTMVPGGPGDAATRDVGAADTRPSLDAKPDAVDAAGVPACQAACERLPNVRLDAGITCVAGRCQVPPSACVEGYGNCTGDPSTGCETELTTSSNCGSCRAVCTGAGVFCRHVSGPWSCSPLCSPPNPDYCGICTDFQSDISNCGGCGRRCDLPSASVACLAGRCTLVSCTSSSWVDCTAVPGCETPLGTDDNCGGCGDKACALANTFFTCHDGRSCAGAVCSPGFANCDASSPDCETSLDGIASPDCMPRYLGTGLAQPVGDGALVVTPDGSTYLIGPFEGTVDVDPTAGVDYRTPRFGTGHFISKLDSGGRYVRTGVLDPQGSSSITGAAPSPTGGVMVTGTYLNAIDLDPGPDVDLQQTSSSNHWASFVVSIRADGTLAWARSFAEGDGDGGTFTSGIAVAPDGAVYLTGQYQGTVDFDPGPGAEISSSQNASGFILKLDPVGGFEWMRSFEDGPCLALLQGVTVASDGNIWAGGGIQVGADCAHQDPSSPSLREDLFIVKVAPTRESPQGPWLVRGASRGTAGVTLAPGADGSVYVGGVASELVDFDPGPSITTSWVGRFESGFVLKLNADGGLQWARTMQFVPVVALAGTPDGGVIAAGALSGLVTRLTAAGVGAWTLPTVEGTFVHRIAAGRDGFAVAGSDAGIGDFDPGSGVDVLPQAGAFLSRYAGF